MQAVFPVQLMEQVITQARRIAVAHCPCRVSYRMVGRGCEHPTEVCLKFDELADFVSRAAETIRLMGIIEVCLSRVPLEPDYPFSSTNLSGVLKKSKRFYID